MQEAPLLGAWIVCLCACFALGCGGEDAGCPALVVLKANPLVLPPDVRETDITVRVETEDPNDPREVVTTLKATSGSFGDVHARETTYACDSAIAGAVDVCVDAKWASGGGDLSLLQEGGSIGSSSEYLRGPHIRDRPDCSSTRCVTVVCPKGPCPEWREILVHPTTQSFGNLVDVRTTVFGSIDESVKVAVDSDCGAVADPLQSGTSSTSVSCDILGSCSVTVKVIDERNSRCDGFSNHASAVIPVFCQLDPL
jgi:hypothetical protein